MDANPPPLKKKTKKNPDNIGFIIMRNRPKTDRPRQRQKQSQIKKTGLIKEKLKSRTKFDSSLFPTVKAVFFTYDNGFVAVVIRIALDGDHALGFGSGHLLHQLLFADHRNGVRKLSAEKFQDSFFRCQRGENVERHEQCAWVNKDNNGK